MVEESVSEVVEDPKVSDADDMDSTREVIVDHSDVDKHRTAADDKESDFEGTSVVDDPTVLSEDETILSKIYRVVQNKQHDFKSNERSARSILSSNRSLDSQKKENKGCKIFLSQVSRF